jgi:hypothetical protein
VVRNLDRIGRVSTLLSSPLLLLLLLREGKDAPSFVMSIQQRPKFWSDLRPMLHVLLAMSMEVVSVAASNLTYP